MQIKLCGDTGDAGTIPDTAHAQKHQDVSTLLSHTSIPKSVCATSTCCTSGLSHLVRGNQAHQSNHVSSLFPVTHRRHRLAERDRRARKPCRKRRHQTPARQSPPRACHSGQRLECCLSTPSACNQPSESAGREREKRSLLSTIWHRKTASNHAVNDDLWRRLVNFPHASSWRHRSGYRCLVCGIQAHRPSWGHTVTIGCPRETGEHCSPKLVTGRRHRTLP